MEMSSDNFCPHSARLMEERSAGQNKAQDKCNLFLWISVTVRTKLGTRDFHTTLNYSHPNQERLHCQRCVVSPSLELILQPWQMQFFVVVFFFFFGTQLYLIPMPCSRTLLTNLVTAFTSKMFK